MSAVDEMQEITVRLSKQTLQKAQILAARQSTSVSFLLASQIDRLVDAEDDYERAMQRAFARMDKGFHLGGVHKLDRDALHER
jgi:predicted transcriptional regulator